MKAYKWYTILETGILDGAHWYEGLIVSAKQAETGFLQVRNKWRSLIPESAVRPLTAEDAQTETARCGARQVADKMLELGFPIAFGREDKIAGAIKAAFAQMKIEEIIGRYLAENKED